MRSETGRAGRTRAEKERLAAYHDLAETMRGLEADPRWGLNESLRLPHEWRQIGGTGGTPSA